MLRGFFLLLLSSVAPVVLAGQACKDHVITVTAMQQALQLTAAVQQELERGKARVAVLGRVGADLSRHGLRYTHAGLAYRQLPDDPWTLLHELNHCGSDTSALHEQGLLNFFLDDPHEYRALVLAPTQKMQQTLLLAVARDHGRSLHGEQYSMIAYPFSTKYQNSNGWLLELLAAAHAGLESGDRSAAQKHLRRTGYRPSLIPISPIERAGASLFSAHVSFTDHPLSERLGGRYSVVSVESVVGWLQAQHLADSVKEVVAN